MVVRGGERKKERKRNIIPHCTHIIVLSFLSRFHSFAVGRRGDFKDRNKGDNSGRWRREGEGKERESYTILHIFQSLVHSIKLSLFCNRQTSKDVARERIMRSSGVREKERQGKVIPHCTLIIALFCLSHLYSCSS